METLEQCIHNVSKEFSSTSLIEKRQIKSEEEVINTFLDAIIDLKALLSTKTKLLNGLISRLEELTWYDFDEERDQEELLQINELIAVARDIRSTLIKQYVSYGFFKKKGIAKEEIKTFKIALNDFKEAVSDVESVFFFLPNLPEFKETTAKIISL